MTHWVGVRPILKTNVYTFNNYFGNIGTISNDQTEYTQYLQTPSAFSCIFSNITEEETITIIDKMENKSSSG